MWFRLGHVWLRMGRSSRAAEAFEKAYKGDTSLKLAIYWKGWAEFKAGRPEEAVREYNRYVSCELDRDDYLAEAYAMIGLILWGKHESALSSYERALRVVPHPSYFINGGRAAFELKDWAKAEAYFKKAIDLHPSNYEAVKGLACTVLKRDDFDEAEKRINWCLERDPADHDLYVARGWIFEHRGQYREAIDALLEAVRLEPDDVNALVGLAACYEEDGSYEDAIKYYSRAMEMEPDNAKHHYLLSNGYYLLKRYPEALEHFRKARVLDVDRKCTDYREYYAEQHVAILTACGLHEEAKAERDALDAAACKPGDST
ncbi:MAG: tetratricopeptide repeat protein [Candidatus Hydrogenedentes bacterium]|nr:tetratricopeptide repeat protein [Candidatus Hydrogenedentota bacterium]